jgi:hypothetical protein
MKKFSVNAKLNAVLNEIFNDLEEMGVNEVRRYVREFWYCNDYNIVQYGNLLIYYSDVRELYKRAGYKSMDKMSDSKIWDIYKRQVGYMARTILKER